MGDIYFKSRFSIPVYKNGISFWMAIRQLVSGKKQYISACLITSLLVLFLSLCGRIDNWMGPNGEGMMSSFGMAAINGKTYDLGVLYYDEDIREDVEQLISSYSSVLNKYEALQSGGAQINDTACQINVISNPEYYHIIEGRTCKYDNEVLVTKTLASSLNIRIGDIVKISFENNTADFIVTGFNECANDMGLNFSVNQKGYSRIRDNIQYFTNYILEDSSKKDIICDNILEKYGDKADIDKNTWSGLDGITSALHAIEVVIYIITVVFIMVVIAMTGSKILHKEKQDLGIYKSLGFNSFKLRIAFALRFGIVAALGSALGVILSAGFSDMLIGAVLKKCGISDFTASVSIIGMVIPAIIVIALFVVFAYLNAGKIKRVDSKILIVE